MAVLPRIVCLNLGSQTLGLAEFEAQPNGGLVLNGHRSREILVDRANDSARLFRLISVNPAYAPMDRKSQS